MGGPAAPTAGPPSGRYASAALADVLGRLSLRGLSDWAAVQGWAAHPRPAFGGLGTPPAMSGVAVLNRLRASADWLGALAAALLTERYPEAVTDPASNGRLPTRSLIAWEPWLVLVDATTVVPPGDKRDYWLVHTVSISLICAFGW